MSYENIYPIESDIKAMVKLTDDSLTDDLITVSMKNADNTINNALTDYSLPTYKHGDENIPNVLVTVGNYIAVSDIHQALDGTDDRSTNELGYYEKAMDMLDRYIRGQCEQLATTSLKQKSPYASSKSPSARQLHLR